MKYYDGMGRDVTDYVSNLEKLVAGLQSQLNAELNRLNKKSDETSGKWIPVEPEVTVEETIKPVRRPRKVADTE